MPDKQLLGGLVGAIIPAGRLRDGPLGVVTLDIRAHDRRVARTARATARD